MQHQIRHTRTRMHAHETTHLTGRAGLRKKSRKCSVQESDNLRHFDETDKFCVHKQKQTLVLKDVKGRNRGCGDLQVMQAGISRVPSFLDYITHGRLNLPPSFSIFNIAAAMFRFTESDVSSLHRAGYAFSGLIATLSHKVHCLHHLLGVRQPSVCCHLLCVSISSSRSLLCEQGCPNCTDPHSLAGCVISLSVAIEFPCPNCTDPHSLAGCEITLSVAIDFTLSNGDPQDPSSLHHTRTDGGWNTYQQAIISVSEVLV